MLETLLGALLIFCLRITDVSVGTLRVLYMVRGQRLMAAILGLAESGIFIFAVSRVFKGDVTTPKMLGYAAGFATGTVLGMWAESWIASGTILARIISREYSDDIRYRLGEAGFGVTAVEGQGRDGERLILFVVCPRRRGKELIDLVRSIDATAFVTVDSVNQAIGGYLPHVATPASVRK